jgi:hypothetical protein
MERDALAGRQPHVDVRDPVASRQHGVSLLAWRSFLPVCGIVAGASRPRVPPGLQKSLLQRGFGSIER